MIERSRKFDAVFVLLMLAAGILAWRVVRIGLADEWSRTSPSKALFWRSDEPRALREAAEAALADKQYDTASNFARRAIRAYPLDGVGYRVLAMADAAQGRKVNVAALLAIAVRRSPRDLPARKAIAVDAFKAGDVAKALHQLDLTMQIQPAIQPIMLSRIAALAEIPQARSALINLLAQNPPWRRAFLRVLATQSPNPVSVASVFSNLKLSDLETGWLIDRQIRDMDFSTAYVSWVASLPEQQRDALGNVFDGSFRFPPSNAGFGWRLSSNVDVQVDGRIGKLSDAAGNGFSVDFDQSRTRFSGLGQFLALSPGHYLFRGRMRAINLTTSRGLQWVISCAGRSKQTLAASPLLKGDQPWQSFEVALDVPADTCAGQLLGFQMGAPDRIDGRVETTGLDIERVGEAIDAPAVPDMRTLRDVSPSAPTKAVQHNHPFKPAKIKFKSVGKRR